jgi:hypothetical protein
MHVYMTIISVYLCLQCLRRQPLWMWLVITSILVYSLVLTSFNAVLVAQPLREITSEHLASVDRLHHLKTPDITSNNPKDGATVDSRSLTISQIFSNSLNKSIDVTWPPPWNTHSSRYMIYKCDGKKLCGGWADREKGIVLSYLLSLVTNRQFGIMLTSPSCPFQSYFEEQHAGRWSVWNSRSLANLTSKHYHLTDSGQFLNNVSKMDFDEYFTEDVVYVTANLDYMKKFLLNTKYVHTLHWMQGLTNDQVFARIVPHILSLGTRLNNTVNDFVSNAKSGPQSRLVCAQIRLGRNPSIPNDSASRANATDVANVWKFLRRMATSQDKIFVTTDSESVREEAKKEFPSQILDTEGAIRHIEKGKKNEEMCSAFEKVLVDQNILSRCDVLMISKSGLARIAAYVRGDAHATYCLHKGKITACRPNNIRALYGVIG